jgi:hypothetical protein
MMKKLNKNMITSSKEKYKKIKAQFLANEILMNEIKEKKYSKKGQRNPFESSRMSMQNLRPGCDIGVTPSKAN